MSVLPASLSPAERRRAEEFAALLDGSRPPRSHELEPLAALVATLRPAPRVEERAGPRADFRAELRDRLVREASRRTPAVPQQRTSPEAAPKHRVRRLVAGVAAGSLVVGASAAVASTRALPGDPLYGLKRGIENVQLKLAGSDLSRGRELLEQADHRLSEAEAMAASSSARSPETERRIASALADMDEATRAGIATLDDVYAATGDPEALRILDRFAVDHGERLADLQQLLDPGLRDQVARLARLLAELQTRVATLLVSAQGAGAGGGVSGVAAGSGSGNSVLAVARSSGDGWAVSRVADQLAGLTSGGVTGGSSSGGSSPASGGGLLADVGSGVSGALDGLTGGHSGGSGTAGSSTGSGSGGLLGGGSGTAGAPSLPRVTGLPVPVPSVAVPSVPLPAATISVGGVSVGTGPKKAPTSPAPAPSSGAGVSVPPLPTCVAVPPLTSC